MYLTTDYLTKLLNLLTALLLCGVVSMNVDARQWQVGADVSLQQAINQSSDGDEILLAPGRYRGNFIIDKALTLTGSPGVVIDAGGKGNALLLKHGNITVQSVRIENWGSDLTAQNAGIYAEQQAQHLLLQNNDLQGDGFGMWLQKADDIRVLHNHITGNRNLRSADRGNGIQLSIVQHAQVRDNDISFTRDGLYIISSQHNVLANNTMHDLRYGVHYMYSHSNQVLNNLAYNTRAGYALMSSKHLLVQGNISRDSEDYGFLLNFITDSTISDNIISNVWTKPEHKVSGRDGKGLFVYNSGYNTIAHNTVQHAEIGIHLTAGSENVKIYGNSFIDNPIQVKYVSNKQQEWSRNGQGNFWSNYLGWDMNNDNIGDVVFEPNDGIDKLLWQYPELKMLMDSPAILVLRWVQKQFPVLKPPGISDSFPLMHMPAHPETKQEQPQ